MSCKCYYIYVSAMYNIVYWYLYSWWYVWTFWAHIVDGGYTLKFHIKTPSTYLDFKEEKHNMSIILSIIGSTCTLSVWMQGGSNWKKMGTWTPKGGVGRPHHGRSRVWWCGMIHVMLHRVIFHPQISSVFPFKGERWKHTDSWAHIKRTKVLQVWDLLHDMWGH